MIDLSLDVIVDLAHHPNIIGIKESGGDVSIVLKLCCIWYILLITVQILTGHAFLFQCFCNMNNFLSECTMTNDILCSYR